VREGEGEVAVAGGVCSGCVFSKHDFAE
jgi:hypothetical protein